LATRSTTEYVHVSREDIVSNQYAATARIVFGLDFSGPDLRKLVANDLETFRHIGQFKPGSINLPSWIPFSLANRVRQSASKSTELLLEYNRKFHANRSSEVQDQSILAWFNREQATESRCPLRFGRTGELDLVRTLFYSATLTTAMTLEWALRILASKRDIVDELTSEIDELITDDCEIVDSLPSLQLCRSFILEVTRLYAVVPTVLKTAVADISVSRSVLISQGTVVITSIHGIHTNPCFWDEPLEFRHDRFLRKDYPHEAFWPFSFGAHVCPGKSLALSELVVSLALILRRFKVHEEPEIDFEGAFQGVLVVPARSDSYRLVRRH
jgi:cytochrome P450